MAPIIERGLVYLPESQEHPGQARTWLDQFLRQLCSFPEARHDDYVDALSQGLRYLRDSGIITLDHFTDNSSMYIDDDAPKERYNPYAV